MTDKQSSIFDEFQASPLATNSPLPDNGEDFNPAETEAEQSSMFGRATFSAMAESKMAKRSKAERIVCPGCRAIVIPTFVQNALDATLECPECNHIMRP